ncbi:MAG: cytochrome b/b6 domain-containing protein, partial [Gammaproteobacteria bacterium]|nr:cytochrome b/b6 domain-containing protein [Gammaproteobacteria bacterium]
MSGTATRTIYRHRLPVRIMHWINVACLFILLMSGLQVFNAHPALYWGNISTFDKPALSLTAKTGADGTLSGQTQIGSLRFDTTGVLGVSKNMAGEDSRRGFPMWATIPGPRNLAEGRRWHFFFAWVFMINGLAYLLWSWRARHLRDDLAPTRSDWRGIGQSIRDHLRFKHPTGDEATRYNVLQKLAYLAVIFIFVPGIVLMGLAMSPHLDSVLGWMVDLVGGRQSARTWHFVIAVAFVAFIAVHVLMVLVSGPVNQIRSMITG